MFNLCHNHVTIGNIACQATFVFTEVAYFGKKIRNDKFIKMSKEFGELLRQYRKLNGLSQSELRNRLNSQEYNVTESTISKWESGIHIPKSEVVEVLEDILMPKSVGLLLKAAGYFNEAEIRFQSSDIVRKQMSQEDERLAANLRSIIFNLRKYLGEYAAVLCYSTTIKETFYGDGSAPAILAGFKEINRGAALEVLVHIKNEFPELVDINDWANLPHERISEDFIHRLISKAHRGNY